MTVGDDCGSGVQQRGGTERHILACEEVSCQLRVERRFATLQICDGDFGEAEFDGRIEFVFGNLAVLEFPNGDRTGRCHLVKALMGSVDHADLAVRRIYGGHDRAHLAISAADGHMLRACRVGQRTKHVEHAWHAERGANRTDKTHGGVEGACESECDAAFVADFAHLFRSQIHGQAERFEAVSSAALG